MARKILTFVLIFSFIAPAFAWAADSVGYIDIRRLVAQSNVGQKARQELVVLQKKKQDEANKKQVEVIALKRKIDDEAATMSPNEQFEKLLEYKRALRDYERLVNEAKEDLTAEDRILTHRVLSEANEVLKKVAKKRGFKVILKDPNVIGYLDPSVDITDDVLKQLNR